MSRKAYLRDVSDEERSVAAAYLRLMSACAPQRRYDLREVFNARRWVDSGCFEAMVSDLHSIIGVAQGRQGQPSAVVMDARTLAMMAYKRRRTSKVHVAVDTLGHLLAVHVTARSQARGFVWLPRRSVVERSFGWLARSRRLARDYERLPTLLRGLHFLVFAVLMLPTAA